MSNGQKALQKLKEDGALPDVCIIEDDFEAPKALLASYPDLKILISSTEDSEKRVTDMLKTGVSGYILKFADPEEMLTAVKALSENKKYFSVGVSDIATPTYQPGLDRRQLSDLASCRFIEQRSNAIFMGKPGVGKTHLANAIGLEAVKRGKKVLFVHTNEMVERLFASRADGSYATTLQRFLKPDLLILDELGFKKMPQNSLEDFFEIVRRRYETGSMIITTNRNFEDWGNLFGDRVIASAIIDRIVHHATIVKLNGNSYRVKNLMELQDIFPNEEVPKGKRGRPRKQESELTGEHENK